VGKKGRIQLGRPLAAWILLGALPSAKIGVRGLVLVKRGRGELEDRESNNRRRNERGGP